MKILIIIPNFEPAWQYGGVMKSAVFLARGLSELGVTIAVYTMNTAGNGQMLDVPLSQKVTLSGVDVFYFKPSIFPKKDFYSRDLVHYLAETASDFDLIYISAMWQYIGVATAKIARKYSIPFIVAPHGSFAKVKMSGFNLKKRIYLFLFRKKLFSNCHAIHFCSDYERDAFSLEYNSPYITVFNPVDDIFINAASDNAQEGCIGWQDSFTLLTAGRPDPIKGFDLCIEALSKLRAEGVRVSLIILGAEDTPYGSELKILAARLGVSDAVEWRPFVSGSELIDEFLRADAYISMGRDENFCIAAAEALCLGMPVVCSDTVGIGEVVDRFGMGQVCSLNPMEAAVAVKAVMKLNQSNRQQIKEQARRLFNKKSIAEKFLEEVSGI